MAIPERWRRQIFDERLLTQFPEGKLCYDTCLTNGWTPKNGDIIRLVTLRYKFRDGKLSEYFPQNQGPIEENKTALFYKWLRERGRLASDTTEEAVPGWETPHFLELTSRNLYRTPEMVRLRSQVRAGLIKP